MEEGKYFCPSCKSDLSSSLITEDYMSGCYCSNCGEDLDDLSWLQPKGEIDHGQRL